MGSDETGQRLNNHGCAILRFFTFNLEETHERVKDTHSFYVMSHILRTKWKLNSNPVSATAYPLEVL